MPEWRGSIIVALVGAAVLLAHSTRPSGHAGAQHWSAASDASDLGGAEKELVESRSVVAMEPDVGFALARLREDERERGRDRDQSGPTASSQGVRTTSEEREERERERDLSSLSPKILLFCFSVC